MNNYTYWEQRGVDSVNRVERTANKAIPEMVKAFEKSKADLKAEVYKFYGKYAENNKISLQQAEKLLNLSELREFKGNLKQFETLAKNSIGTFDLQVANLSTKSRITRLQALETQIDGILQRLYQEQRTIVETTATEVYKQEYYHSLFDTEQYTGFQFRFSQVPTAAIEQVIKQPVMGADISTRLWRQDIDTGFKIRQTLTDMFTTGKPPQSFAKELQKTIGAVRVENGIVKGTGKKYEAYRLLYNEASYASGQANLDSYKADDVEEYEIIATLDTKTSEICREQDGKHYPIEKAVAGVNYPPFHVNCRTTTAPYIDLEGFEPTRMARDKETGKSVRVKEQTYREWAKAKGVE